MTVKKMEDMVFRRELQNILDRLRSYGTLFDERLERVDKKNEEIDSIVDSQGASAAFGSQKVLVSELVSLLKEAEPTFRSIRDSVLQMKLELQRSKAVEEHEQPGAMEVEEIGDESDEDGE